jgi:pilus assembly protein CpaF
MKMMRRILSSSLDLIIQLQRLQDGSAKIVSLSELSEAQNDVILPRDIFLRQEIEEEEGESIALLCPTGIKPRFTQRLQTLGISLPVEMFIPIHKKKRAAS